MDILVPYMSIKQFNVHTIKWTTSISQYTDYQYIISK
jgi:hypothetical protein